MTKQLGHRVTQALVTVIVVCAAVRLAAWLLTPLMPLLGVLVVITGVLIVATRGR
jgi:CHASE2 domain-containing sensor protein